MKQQTVHTHGRKILNLGQISTMTQEMSPTGGCHYLQLAWDPDSGQLHYSEHIDPLFSDPGDWSYPMVPCGIINHPMSEQEIADQVNRALNKWVDLSYLVDESSCPDLPN